MFSSVLTMSDTSKNPFKQLSLLLIYCRICFMFRFTKHRVAPPQTVSPSHNGKSRHDHNGCMRSPYRSERDKRSVKFDGINTTPSGEESEFKTSLTDCNKYVLCSFICPFLYTCHNSKRLGGCRDN